MRAKKKPLPSGSTNVTIGTSESDCERYISKQRYVAGDFGTNFYIDTMKHRLQVLSDFTEMNE